MAVSLALFALLVPAQPARAWGYRGHRVIADIAMARLTPQTRRSLKELIGDNDLASISTWADDVKNVLPETRPWHYVDIPSSASGFDSDRDCPGGACVVAKIQQFEQVLGNKDQPLAARRMALEFLVHFVGDVHQPFHALAEARGGNDIPVVFFGSQTCGCYACNLHGVWDTDLIMRRGLREHRYTYRLEAMIADQHLQAGDSTPEEWANESFRLAKQATVKPGAEIGEAYYNRELPTIDHQLALAGLRLAKVLNNELGTSGEASREGHASLCKHN